MAHKKQKILLLHRQVESWLSEISPGVIVDFMEQPTRDSFLSFFKFNIKDGLTNNIRPQHVGFGISYALPTIVTLLSAKPDKLIILENPEAHLHPKGQSKIGEMMARAAQGEAQLIVETHSDHIINGVRVAVKEGKLDPEKVKIFYFDRNPDSKEHYSFVREMNIDADGRIDYWPEGFMDEWDKNLMELLK
jgi:predicted ATPase